MPITAFNSFTDGLDPNRRSREHFVTNINLEDGVAGFPMPMVSGSSLPLQRHVRGIQRRSEGLPGAMLGTHYHVGTVRGYTMRGHWRYLEHDWVAKPGTFIYEPAGEAHTLVITKDSPEPALIMFVVEGGLIYLDKPVDGGVAAYEDGFTALELTRKYYREAGLDVRELDRLVASRPRSVCGAAQTRGRLAGMKPNYILVLLLLYIAALSGMTSYLDARRIAEPQWSVVVTSLIASSLIFWWYWADSTSRSYRRSPLLNVAIVAIAFFAVPYYLLRGPEIGRRFQAVAKMFGFVLLMAGASVVGPLPVALVS